MRTNLILAITAGVLAIPTAITFYNDRTDFTDYADIPRLFDGFMPERVKFVVLTAPKKADEKKADEAPKSTEPKQDDKKPELQQLVLVKTDDGKWVLGNTELKGVPVQQQKVDTDILDHLKKIRIDSKSVIQPNQTLSPDDEKKWLADGELTEDTGLVIQCLDDHQAPVAELIVGKDLSGGKWTEDVVRGRLVRAKDAKVAVAYEVDYWRPSVEKNEWIDTKVHQFDMAKVKSFTLRNEKGEVAFEKAADAGAKWKAAKAPADSGPVREQEVTNLMSRFQYLNAQRFIEPLAGVPEARLAQLGLKPGQIEISATVREGDKDTDTKVYTLVIGTKTEKNEYYARSNHSDFLLAIGDWERSPYEKDPKDFFEPSAATAAQAVPNGQGGASAAPATGTKTGEPPPTTTNKDEQAAKDKQAANEAEQAHKGQGEPPSPPPTKEPSKEPAKGDGK